MHNLLKKLTIKALMSALLIAFSMSSSVAKVFDSAEMKAAAARNGKYCSLGRWPSMGSPGSVKTSPTIIKKGDLADSYNNITPAVTKLYWLNNEAIRRGKISNLKEYFMSMVNRGHFTEIGTFYPESYYGDKVPKFIADHYKKNPYSETTYFSGILFTAASQSLGILKPHLTKQELDAAKRWGRILYMDVTRHRTTKLGKDITASLAAGFTTWGYVAGDAKILKKGKSFFNLGIRNITHTGLEKQFVQGYTKERELKYFHMTFGHLAIAAWAIEKNGGKAFDKRSGGGSLIDAFNYFLTASFFPDKRKGISKKQQLTAYTKKARDVYWSMSYLEYIKDAGVTDAQIPLLNQSLAVGRSGGGFYNTFFGGFSSCFLAD